MLSNQNEQVILSQKYLASVSWEISSGYILLMKGKHRRLQEIRMRMRGKMISRRVLDRQVILPTRV